MYPTGGLLMLVYQLYTGGSSTPSNVMVTENGIPMTTEDGIDMITEG